MFSFDDDYSKKLIQFYKFNDQKESIVLHKAIALPINTLFQFSLRIPILNLQKA